MRFGVFLCLIALRTLNAVLVQTSFVADEFWQSLEVAHSIVFGVGHLTWEWILAVRSVVFPGLYVPGFLACSALDSDHAGRCALLSAKVVQVLLAVLCDISVHLLARRLFGSMVSKYSLLCHCFCWFHFFTCTRTLINTLETVLLTTAVAHWPWPLESLQAPAFMSTRRLPSTSAYGNIAVCLATLISFLRPTCAVYFVVLALSTAPFFDLFKRLSKYSMPIVVACVLMDRAFYGLWTLTPWNFFNLNVLQDVASQYGVHPWHWYLTQCLPATLLVLFPLTLFSIFSLRAWSHPVLMAAGAYLAALSLAPHKELRFVQALLPIFCCYAGFSLHYLRANRHLFILVATAALVTHVPTALYTSLVHQRGPLDAINLLAGDLKSQSNASLLFLTPCHTTPLYSHLHRNISTQFLRCDSIPCLRHALWEQEAFFQNPVQWLEAHESLLQPSHIVLFDIEERRISPWLTLHKFTRMHRIFHSHFPEGNVGRFILIYGRE